MHNVRISERDIWLFVYSKSEACRGQVSLLDLYPMTTFPYMVRQRKQSFHPLAAGPTHINVHSLLYARSGK